MKVFFLCIISLLIFIISSKIKIEILELRIDTENKIRKLRGNLNLCLFNKIKWIQITLSTEKIKKLNKGTKILDLIKEQTIKNLKIIFLNRKKISTNYIDIEKLNLKLDVGTENAALTSFVYAFIASTIPILLAKNGKQYSYEINPYYTNKNFLTLTINCIISINLVHIIIKTCSEIKKSEKVSSFNKKGVVKYGGTSN